MRREVSGPIPRVRRVVVERGHVAIAGLVVAFAVSIVAVVLGSVSPRPN